MSWILLVSIAVRLAALAWSAVLWRRLRDWRMGLLTAMLALMVARQSLTLLHLWTRGDTQVSMLHELPGLAVSGLALVFVVLLDRLVMTRRLAVSGRAAAESQLAGLEEHYRRVTELVSAATGETFFRRLVEGLTEVLDADYALVAELDEGEPEMARTLAFCAAGEVVDNVAYELDRSPCERVMESGVCVYPAGVRAAFPGDRLLAEMEVESYVGTPLRDSSGRALGLLAVMGSQPLTRPEPTESILRIFALRASAELERLRASKALWRSEERYRSLFEQSLDAIFISTPSGELVDINPAGVELFGYDSREELLQVDIARDLYWDPWQRDRSLRQLDADGVLREHELVLKRKDGTKLLVVESSVAVRDENGGVLAVQGILRDVTERRRLEEELRRSQRMEAVGRLAGGIAHDFNNLLTVINGQTDLILAGLGADDPLSKEVGEIKAAGRRAAALTRQLLILSRRRSARQETVDLAAMLGEQEPLLRQVVGRDVEVVLRLAADLPPVRIDRSLLEQVLLNLAINAREAMAGTGRLTIEAGSMTVSGEPGPAPVGLEPGAYVRLRVQDTGAGVDDQAREHLFEPFYSPAGAGESGLGLATVYGIVEQSGGAIRVDSEPGRGTAFEILLPEAGAERVAPAPRAVAGDGSGSETILVAEDELPVRNLLQEYLVTQGYRVIEAADGNEAMEIADRAGERIDLVLADVVMPGMRGSELARQLAEHHPRIKVLLMSGYAEAPPAGVDGDPRLAGSEFIQKPFSTEALGLKVRELLDRES